MIIILQKRKILLTLFIFFRVAERFFLLISALRPYPQRAASDACCSIRIYLPNFRMAKSYWVFTSSQFTTFQKAPT
jgi:hypothetical protein